MTNTKFPAHHFFYFTFWKYSITLIMSNLCPVNKSTTLFSMSTIESLIAQLHADYFLKKIVRLCYKQLPTQACIKDWSIDILDNF